MTPWILHHYPGSPYAEKARLMLGYKGMPWRSLEVPPIPPRPSLQPLLGGFRRIPVLQRGADFFCDSRLLPDLLDSLSPEPPLMPAAGRALSTLIAQWAEPRVFVKMGPVRFETRDDLQLITSVGLDPAEFRRDRAPFMLPAADTTRAALVRGSARDHVVSYLAVLELLLRAGSGFLCGGHPVAADFSAYHTVWWLRRPPARDALLEPFAALRAWADRMASIGHGRFEPAGVEDALQAVRAAQSAAPWHPEWPQVNDARIGQPVQICADDYGRDPIGGTLAAVSDRHVTLRREVPGFGVVQVHFPKVGYELTEIDAT